MCDARRSSRYTAGTSASLSAEILHKNVVSQVHNYMSQMQNDTLSHFVSIWQPAACGKGSNSWMVHFVNAQALAYY